MRGTRRGKQVCEEGCAVRGAGTAIHLLFHLQGNVRSWQKGSTPRHYFRHNIRPMHTIKQWQHLNSHRTSTYPFSLNNESEEEATFFFSYAKDNSQKQWEENMIHIGEYFKKDDMCLHCHCTELVAGGSNNPGQITQRSSRLPRKGSSLPKTHSATSALKWSLVRSTNDVIILFNSRHVRMDSDTALITWGMWHFSVVVFVYLVCTP